LPGADRIDTVSIVAGIIQFQVSVYGNLWQKQAPDIRLVWKITEESFAEHHTSINLIRVIKRDYVRPDPLYVILINGEAENHIRVGNMFNY